VLSRLQAIATLRQASYGLADIAHLLGAIDAGQGIDMLASELRRASQRTMEATAGLWSYIAGRGDECVTPGPALRARGSPLEEPKAFSP
jgi:hypothetical protein